MDQFKCQACKSCFENSSQLALHIKYHVSFRSFKCMLCDNFHQRCSPYDRLRQNNRYVGCVHKNNVDFNQVNKKQSYHKVTQEYAEECTVEDLDLDNLSSKEVKVLKEMIAQLEHYEQENQ